MTDDTATTDYLRVDQLDEYNSGGYPYFQVYDPISNTHRGRKTIRGDVLEKQLEERREYWAKKFLPDRPKRLASMIRWLYGFPMLPEHNE
jgi:hypothetical protein